MYTYIYIPGGILQGDGLPAHRALRASLTPGKKKSQFGTLNMRIENFGRFSSIYQMTEKLRLQNTLNFRFCSKRKNNRD